MNYTDAEIKVREATTEESWGPTPDMMREIAGLTFQYDSFPEVMGMLWKRMLPPSPVAWRHTYKVYFFVQTRIMVIFLFSVLVPYFVGIFVEEWMRKGYFQCP